MRIQELFPDSSTGKGAHALGSSFSAFPRSLSRGWIRSRVGTLVPRWDASVSGMALPNSNVSQEFFLIMIIWYPKFKQVLEVVQVAMSES